MATYILKKIKSQLENIEVLQQKNTFAELEVRFGKTGTVFNSNLGEDIFRKIFNNYILNNEKITNEIIIDYIFSKKVTTQFLGKTDFKSKFLKKIIYHEKNKDMTTDFNLKKYNPEKNTEYDSIEYSIKEKKSQYTKDTFRYTYSLENEIDITNKNTELLHKSNNPYDTIRLKNRYSTILNDFLRLDMTIVKTISPKTNQESKDLEYIVEIEILKKPINLKIAMKSLKEHSKNIRRIYFDKREFMFNIATMNPQTMEKKDLSGLKKYQYTVTDKADGERVFLMFFDKEVILYNPKTQQTILKFPNTTDLDDTIIDGEYLEDTKEFLAFDMLFHNYKDIRDKFLDKRLQILTTVKDKYFSLFKNITLKMKTFYSTDIFSKAKHLWENRETLFHYELDGLIFTPIKQVYTTDKQEIPILKWKEKLSIDVRIEYNFRENFTYFHHGSKNNYSKPWNMKPHRNLINKQEYQEQFNKDIYHLRWVSNNKNLINNINSLNIGKINNGRLFLGIEGTPQLNSNIRQMWSKYDIIEYEYDFRMNQWIGIRKRTFDKEKANAYKTIESIIKSLINYISLKDLYDLQHQNAENIGQMYDLTRDTIKRKNWRFFHNFVKNQLYKQVSKVVDTKNNYHLEFACGKGGDLQKWMKNGYTNVLAIDSSKEEIYGKNGIQERLVGLGFKKENHYYIKNGMKITIIWGDITKNVKNGESGLSEMEKLKLYTFFENLPENWKGFNSISIMFAIHYLFGDMIDNDKPWIKNKGKLEGLTNNIKELLKYDGVVFGTYLNGNNMTEDNMKFIHNGDVIYEIEHLLKNKIRKNIAYNTFFKTKDINTIKISNEVWGKNVKISEPQINKDVLNVVFKKNGLIPVRENNTFSQYYNDFKEVTSKELGKGEQQLSFINNTFMFSYVNLEKIILEINELLEVNIYNKRELLEYLKINIENDELDGKIKQLYKILIKGSF